MNPAWLHLDFDYAKNETEFGKPLVNSMLTLATVIGISVHETTLGTTVANLGFQAITFPAPLFHGDTIRVVTRIKEMRESKSRPTAGLVVFEHVGFNQRGEEVCYCLRTGLMKKRPA